MSAERAADGRGGLRPAPHVPDDRPAAGMQDNEDVKVTRPARRSGDPHGNRRRKGRSGPPHVRKRD
jgi:hypothetical protein